MPQSFWRVVKHNPPEESDFYSHTRRGLRPLGAEGAGYDAVLVYESLQGMQRAQRISRIRGFIVELRIPEGAPVHWEREGPPGHYNLWGEPATLLSYVGIPLATEDWWG